MSSLLCTETFHSRSDPSFLTCAQNRGGSIHLGTKTAPDMFGEIALGKVHVGGEARSVRHTTVTATEPCTFLIMEKAAFEEAKKTESFEEWNKYLDILGNMDIRSYIKGVPL